MNKLSLKAQNVVPLSMLILFQCVIAYVLATDNVEAFTQKLISPSSSVLFLMGVLSSWFSFLLPVGIKNSMVFLRLDNVLPGHRFIQLCESDPRIDSDSLRTSIQDYLLLKADQAKQNQYWYLKIYRPNVDEREVASAHKSYLLYRDASVVSAVFIVCLLAASLFLPSVTEVLSAGFIVIMIVCFVGFLVAANTAGKRFVTTTVAIYLAGILERMPHETVKE
mgnify:CR=1 FL=1